MSGYTNVDGICKMFGIVIDHLLQRTDATSRDDAHDLHAPVRVTVHRAQFARPRRTADGVRARGSTLDSNDVLHPRVTLVSTETRSQS